MLKLLRSKLLSIIYSFPFKNMKVLKKQVLEDWERRLSQFAQFGAKTTSKSLVAHFSFCFFLLQELINVYKCSVVYPKTFSLWMLNFRLQSYTVCLNLILSIFSCVDPDPYSEYGSWSTILLFTYNSARTEQPDVQCTYCMVVSLWEIFLLQFFHTAHDCDIFLE